MKVGVVGASGYAGVELLRLCAGHPDLDVVVATAGAHAGQTLASHSPSLAAAYPSLSYVATEASELDGLDLVFLALPHGQSQHLVPELIPAVGALVDLAADFRLEDPALYPIWYGEPHVAPELLSQFVYGLPELHRDRLRGARLIAAPGCYPTAALLALTPLVEAGIVAAPPAGGLGDGRTAGASTSDAAKRSLPAPSLIVDAASGVSGAGRAPKDHLHFGSVTEDFVAYGLLDHRHTAEMEQGLGTPVLFTPHLAPMARGILATCYARPGAATTQIGPDGPTGPREPAGPDGPTGSQGPTGSVPTPTAHHRGRDLPTTEDAMDVLHQRYDEEPFVVVTDDPPSTKATRGSNCAHVSVTVDPRTGWVLAFAAIDNLVKGAAGQAVQCANLALDLPEGTGLPLAGTYP
jgi:N-acetyl-gamma-glutamyl-phosphate reductase